MRIGLLGGTFDPVHYGHLLMAEAAREQFRLSRVIFVLAGRPPHKKPPRTSPRDRLAMLRLAVRSNPAFQVSDWEVRQKRVVYTFELLEHFRQRYPKDALYFIVGADSLRDLPGWRQGARLPSLCTFLAADRPGISWSDIPPAVRRKARRLRGPAVPFASHLIREACARGRSVRYQVPEAVHAYLQSRRLYGRSA
jgi:nicotinate-nucleotide adenylyltransferase